MHHVAYKKLYRRNWCRINTSWFNVLVHITWYVGCHFRCCHPTLDCSKLQGIYVPTNWVQRDIAGKQYISIQSYLIKAIEKIILKFAYKIHPNKSTMSSIINKFENFEYLCKIIASLLFLFFCILVFKKLRSNAIVI